MFITELQPSRAFEWTQESWGPALQCVRLRGVAPHLFTVGNLRLGPESDEWLAVAGALGIGRDAIRLVRQVHGTAVAVARKGTSAAWSLPEADVVVSDDEKVAIGVRVADCAPVLIGDRRRAAVAAVHAGWRGTMRRAAPRAVQALMEEFGSNPCDLIVAIGPCLALCCGEVGLEVVDAFRQAGHEPGEIDRWFRPGPRRRPHFDLLLANCDQLQRAGVPPDQIHAAELCTKSHSGLFHSYRAAGPGAGRMAGLIRAGH